MNADALLEMRGVAIDAGPRRLLDALDWHVAPGEFWCVIGANGAGKTSLLNVAAGLVAPAAGHVRVLGREQAAWRVDALARVRGLLPQQPDAPFGLSALQAVLLGRHPHGGSRLWESDADLALARAAMDRVGVAELAERDMPTLSGGERQRVALAALVAQAPRLYLLDEPLAWLDLRHQLATMRLLRGLADDGAGVAAVVHDASLAARHATHALLIERGGRVVAGPVGVALDARTLSAAMGFPMRRVEFDGHVAFVPGTEA